MESQRNAGPLEIERSLPGTRNIGGVGRRQQSDKWQQQEQAQNKLHKQPPKALPSVAQGLSPPVTKLTNRAPSFLCSLLPLFPRSLYFGTMKSMPRFPVGQTLLIDADDTLWENNVYFERAIAAFIGYLNHHTYTPAEIRNQLNAVERETILERGYGLTSFTQSLVTCFERLSAEPVTGEKRERVISFAHTIRDQEIELLPGVAETLADLGARHRLILMTKGDHAEQADKLARSGLAPLFNAVEIVSEKDPTAYHAVIARHELTPHTSWMIGNSPKSDINPALAAGLHAVFLFHKDTWILEHAEVDAPPNGQRLIELDSFAKLCDIF
jgi:putative hydrolase of the HAD superfamily